MKKNCLREHTKNERDTMKNNNEIDVLYKNIKSRRLELGMTMEELAKKVGYNSKSSISKVESGEYDLTQTQIYDFADALETTASDLMGLSTNNVLTDLEVQFYCLTLLEKINSADPKVNQEYLKKIGVDCHDLTFEELDYIKKRIHEIYQRTIKLVPPPTLKRVFKS